jgi:hypothetical protein
VTDCGRTPTRVPRRIRYGPFVTFSVVDGGMRALRLVAFSATATVLALGAHVLAGGEPPAALPTVAAVGLPAMAAIALSRRRRRLLEISVALGAVQLVLHELFSAVPAGASGHAHVGHSPEPWMPITHTLAVVITAVGLAYGDRALHLMRDWLRAVPSAWRAAGPAVLADLPFALPAPVVGRPAPLSLRGCAPVVRRGPPACWC